MLVECADYSTILCYLFRFLTQVISAALFWWIQVWRKFVRVIRLLALVILVDLVVLFRLLRMVGLNVVFNCGVHVAVRCDKTCIC